MSFNHRGFLGVPRPPPKKHAIYPLLPPNGYTLGQSSCVGSPLRASAHLDLLAHRIVIHAAMAGERVVNKSIKAIVVAMSLFASANAFAACVGSTGPGGACSTGPGGGLSTGPGGGLSTGPGGGMSTGPGGGLSTGPGGGLSTGPGGGLSTGPGGGLSTGPGGGCSTGPGGNPDPWNRANPRC